MRSRTSNQRATIEQEPKAQRRYQGRKSRHKMSIPLIIFIASSLKQVAGISHELIVCRVKVPLPRLGPPTQNCPPVSSARSWYEYGSDLADIVHPVLLIEMLSTKYEISIIERSLCLEKNGFYLRRLTTNTGRQDFCTVACLMPGTDFGITRKTPSTLIRSRRFQTRSSSAMRTQVPYLFQGLIPPYERPLKFTSTNCSAFLSGHLPSKGLEHNYMAVSRTFGFDLRNHTYRTH